MNKKTNQLYCSVCECIVSVSVHHSMFHSHRLDQTQSCRCGRAVAMTFRLWSRQAKKSSTRPVGTSTTSPTVRTGRSTTTARDSVCFHFQYFFTFAFLLSHVFQNTNPVIVSQCRRRLGKVQKVRSLSQFLTWQTYISFKGCFLCVCSCF